MPVTNNYQFSDILNSPTFKIPDYWNNKFSCADRFYQKENFGKYILTAGAVVTTAAYAFSLSPVIIAAGAITLVFGAYHYRKTDFPQDSQFVIRQEKNKLEREFNSELLTTYGEALFNWHLDDCKSLEELENRFEGLMRKLSTDQKGKIKDKWLAIVKEGLIYSHEYACFKELNYREFGVTKEELWKTLFSRLSIQDPKEFERFIKISDKHDCIENFIFTVDELAEELNNKADLQYTLDFLEHSFWIDRLGSDYKTALIQKIHFVHFKESLLDVLHKMIQDNDGDNLIDAFHDKFASILYKLFRDNMRVEDDPALKYIMATVLNAAFRNPSFMQTDKFKALTNNPCWKIHFEKYVPFLESKIVDIENQKSSCVELEATKAELDKKLNAFNKKLENKAVQKNIALAPSQEERQQNYANVNAKGNYEILLENINISMKRVNEIHGYLSESALEDEQNEFRALMFGLDSSISKISRELKSFYDENLSYRNFSNKKVFNDSLLSLGYTLATLRDACSPEIESYNTKISAFNQKLDIYNSAVSTTIATLRKENPVYIEYTKACQIYIRDTLLQETKAAYEQTLVRA